MIHLTGKSALINAFNGLATSREHCSLRESAKVLGRTSPKKIINGIIRRKTINIHRVSIKEIQSDVERTAKAIVKKRLPTRVER
jgi:hypothetical protein